MDCMSENTYVIDSESAAEMARLINQDQIVTAAMGGIFPPELEVPALTSVLDLACGPGGWAQELAFQYPQIQVTGIDISQQMILFARAQARVQGLDNAHFLVMDATRPLSLPDASFDLVNARFTMAFVREAEVWQAMVGEMVRVTRPGGIIRLTEGDDLGRTSSLAFQQLMDLAIQAGQQEGRTISAAQISQLLLHAGCQQFHERWSSVDYSAGTRAYSEMVHNCQVWAALIQPYLLKMQVATQDQVEALHAQMQVEMLSDDFTGTWRFLSVWGTKPAG
jgi:ubiquinone/menaquinone biosynthesis C-methylase UbiE